GGGKRVYGDDSLEIFNDDLRGAPPRQSAHDAMRSLLFVEEQVRRAMRSKEADAHLERVDHIAQALPEGRLDAWVLFYRTLLGLEPEGAVDLPDPYGLVRSKAMSNRERTVRFPLNISESRHTATAPSVTNFAGAGISHI